MARDGEVRSGKVINGNLCMRLRNLRFHPVAIDQTVERAAMLRYGGRVAI